MPDETDHDALATDLIAGSVADLEAQLADTPLPVLEAALAAETAKANGGRVSAIAALEAAIAAHSEADANAPEPPVTEPLPIDGTEPMPHHDFHPHVVDPATIAQVEQIEGVSPVGLHVAGDAVDPNVIVADGSMAPRDPVAEAEATKNNALLAATHVPMSHPDGGTSDQYESDADGNILVPASEADAMTSLGFVVAGG